MSFRWSPTFYLDFQLQKYDLSPKNPNPCLRKQLGLNRKNLLYAKIGVRFSKLEHDGCIKINVETDAPSNRSTMKSHRSPIFTVLKCLQFAAKSEYDSRNRSTIPCFLKHFNFSLLQLLTHTKSPELNSKLINMVLKTIYDLVSSGHLLSVKEEDAQEIKQLPLPQNQMVLHPSHNINRLKFVHDY